jgi:hypothetical protein
LIGTLSVCPAIRKRRSLNSTRIAAHVGQRGLARRRQLVGAAREQDARRQLHHHLAVAEPDLELAGVDQRAEPLLQLAVRGEPLLLRVALAAQLLDLGDRGLLLAAIRPRPSIQNRASVSATCTCGKCPFLRHNAVDLFNDY